MERIRVISHQGHSILLVDCSNCAADEISALADQVPAAVAALPSGSARLLADFTNAQLSRDAIERIKIAAVFNSQYLKRSAWIVDGAPSMSAHDIVERFSTRDIAVFDARDAALDYLVKESE
jgi:hypothetical protein